jgi:hypothetical protein
MRAATAGADVHALLARVDQSRAAVATTVGESGCVGELLRRSAPTLVPHGKWSRGEAPNPSEVMMMSTKELIYRAFAFRLRSGTLPNTADLGPRGRFADP